MFLHLLNSKLIHFFWNFFSFWGTPVSTIVWNILKRFCFVWNPVFREKGGLCVCSCVCAWANRERIGSIWVRFEMFLASAVSKLVHFLRNFVGSSEILVSSNVKITWTYLVSFEISFPPILTIVRTVCVCAVCAGCCVFAVYLLCARIVRMQWRTIGVRIERMLGDCSEWRANGERMESEWALNRERIGANRKRIESE